MLHFGSRQISSHLLRSLPTAFNGLTLSQASPAAAALGDVGGVRQASRHGGNHNFKKDFFILKDYPVGPHKQLAPRVKLKGKDGVTRIGPREPYENYFRYKIHYPEDGKYTINRLPVHKMGGRDPVTGRKVIQRTGGGHKKKARWIDARRWPVDRDPQGPDLEERVVLVRYDPLRKPMIALTGTYPSFFFLADCGS